MRSQRGKQEELSMGYLMDMKEANFEIRKENKGTALTLLKNLVSEQQKNMRFGWVNCQTVLQAETLSVALEECRYDVDEDDDGNIVDIYFTGEKLDNDYAIFKAIAPAVTKGSYIEMYGESDDRWRWTFNGDECIESDLIITWDDNISNYATYNPATQIAIIWSIEDVKSIRPDLSNEQALAVLHKAKDNHDAKIGINWTALEIWADLEFPKEMMKTRRKRRTQK